MSERTRSRDEGLERIGNAIMAAFSSPNVLDANLEDANIVDVLNHLALSMDRLSGADTPANPLSALERHADVMLTGSREVATGLHDIADAIREGHKA